MRKILVLVFIFTGSFLVHADIPAENICYDPMIRTIQVHKEADALSMPLIHLGSEERLAFSFDDLGPDLKRYKFTIQQCNFDWTLNERMDPADFIAGWREENIDRFEYSYNTTVKYIHFSAVFPTENMSPKVSGNYLLIVYEEEPYRIVFTRRFLVAETTPLTLSGRVVQSSMPGVQQMSQQVDFLVNLNGFQINDVTREIRTVVQQNGRTDNEIIILKPRFSRPGELDYRYDENITFAGGNQFRNFDIKSLLYQSEYIRKILFDTMTQVYLLNDLPRTYKQYTFDQDLNGRFFIKNEEHAENSAIEADYALVHFFLPYPAAIPNGDFYILGDLTQMQLNDASKMNYNFSRRGYETDLLLKQGYYNYLYVFREKGRVRGDETLIEGSHWETENDYSIRIYYTETGSLYSRLIGAYTLNSATR
ncbi:MAG: DUF5103 domain-containing protein [Alphaproteobacteria bacterium]|nr:DUF5103 domain-containing protein [Alphaproteobacteria bacterium]